MTDNPALRVYGRLSIGGGLEYFDTDPELTVAAALADYPHMDALEDCVDAVVTILEALSPGDNIRIRRFEMGTVGFSVYHMTQEEYDDLPYPEDIEEDEDDG